MTGPLSAAPKRKRPPLLVQLHAALRQLGLEPDECELDHDPALGIRAVNADGTDWDPPQHDERYLVWRPKREHDVKTFGPGGEKRITTAGGDIHRIAKLRRLTTEQEEHRRRMLGKEPGSQRPRSSRWPSRPFSKRKQKG
ncbi:hypothetical protein [Chelatococcus reniformis]|uniref:Uncharacterized protein n=1 Tax=Chelatococcus reniformis TaxID=1494448 RepID=A0A916XHB2_9HYPH|nr:hypothetical protein [Chelatococcus reniformis]GGC70437.1 hypothetical protein GCM10010994_31210 [Chelatococcus reniformis]